MNVLTIALFGYLIVWGGSRASESKSLELDKAFDLTLEKKLQAQQLEEQKKQDQTWSRQQQFARETEIARKARKSAENKLKLS